MKVFVYRGTELEFFKSLSDVESFLDLIIDTDLRKEVEDEDGNIYHAYSLDGETWEDLLEFDFEDDETVSFMETNGPSSECCTSCKKSNLDFFVEATGYMNISIKTCHEIGDRIIVTNEDYDNYNQTMYQYFDSTGPTDLMTFKLIEVKWYTNENSGGITGQRATLVNN